MKDLAAAALTWAAIIAVALLLFAMYGCASAGFFQMSDQWCQEHQEASANRCAGRDS